MRAVVGAGVLLKIAKSEATSNTKNCHSELIAYHSEQIEKF